jgi:hypothetical protein
VFATLIFGNVLQIWNCWAWGAVQAVNCFTTSQYVAVLRDEAVYGDQKTRAFVLNSTGGIEGILVFFWKMNKV